MIYKEEDYLMLSGIQHFEFCRRQWALIHIEQQWDENLRTVEGNIFHKRAHDGLLNEKRKEVIITRGMNIASPTLGISGICDIVEFHRDDQAGVSIFGREGKYRVYPVEYKRGEPKASDVDVLQVTAQAMCLEEMLCTDIDKGYLFYGETKRRLTVIIDTELREKVCTKFAEMHEYYKRRYTPKVKPNKSCKACSLKDLCLPKLCKNKSARNYIEKKIGEGNAE
ncbi:MAG: CRISPR-associated protein Cas4 [Eubacterium sp.]